MGNEYEFCSYRIYEMSNSRAISGRRKIKLILHEIFPNNSVWQTNGISWNETYTQQNIESVANMSICVEFISDERRLPYGHGLTEIRDNIPYMENATVVGHCESAYIEDVEIDGVVKKALVAEGYIDEMRYPKFVAWLSERLAEGSVKGSVEIVGRPEYENRIIYDGGWKETGRVPQFYDYSGYAILGIRPADDTAIVVELNNKKEEDKEVKLMDEKTLNQLIADVKSSVTQVITELNSKDSDYETQIGELNNKVSTMETTIAELNEAVTTAAAEITEKDSVIEAKDVEINSLIEANKTLVKEKKVAELSSALSEFTQEEQALAQAEIDAFKADPDSVEINSITSKICVEMVRLNKEARTNEQNSTAPDIFGGITSTENKETVEIF